MTLLELQEWRERREVELLRGWDRIAAYLGVSERTARRWHKQGLPVERRGGIWTGRPAALVAWRVLGGVGGRGGGLRALSGASILRLWRQDQTGEFDRRAGGVGAAFEDLTGESGSLVEEDCGREFSRNLRDLLAVEDAAEKALRERLERGALSAPQFRFCPVGAGYVSFFIRRKSAVQICDRPPLEPAGIADFFVGRRSRRLRVAAERTVARRRGRACPRREMERSGGVPVRACYLGVLARRRCSLDDADRTVRGARRIGRVKDDGGAPLRHATRDGWKKEGPPAHAKE